jgi:PhnB protein
MSMLVCPYLAVRGAARAIEFYQKVFGATEAYRLTDPDSGKIGHAEILIGESRIMLADEAPAWGHLSPEAVGGCPVKFHLAVDNVDEMVQRAVDAGAILLRPVADEFYGERMGMVTDPYGFSWHISTTKTEVSPEEMQRRWNEVFEEKK